ncbi:MAG: enoyl-CoA hydratase/carnithine racemase, partial [Myxococcota bacterium]
MQLAPGLRLERDGAFARLVLDRPSKRNALDGPMWEGLGQVPVALEDDPPRALIVHGAGEHFSAGMDLSPTNPLLARLLPAIGAKDHAAARDLIGDLKRWVGSLKTLPFPVIAAVEGACAGGALELALACDLIVAGRSAFFSLPETQVGMVPDMGGTVRITRAIGPARAAELVLTGNRITAEQALAWGLINRLVDDGTALDAGLALARETTRAAPGCARAILPVLRAAAGTPDA